LAIPLYSHKVVAGFPSPADDYLEGTFCLNEMLIKHPAATFMVRAAGESMINAGIEENDHLIVDRSLTPKDNDIVIAAVDGQLTVKRFQKKGEAVFLQPDNPRFATIEVKENSEITIFGVVTNIIKHVRK